MIENLMKRLKLIFSNEKVSSENEFYEQLFINNTSWNTKTPNPDESKRWEIIEDFIRQIVGSKTDKFNILDLGSGRGWLTNLLSSYGKTVGVEPVAKVVDYAKKLFPNLEFVVGSTKELLSTNYENYFDLIVCTEVIEHVDNHDKERFINDISLLLKPKGHFIISTPRKEVQVEWLKGLKSTQPLEEWLTEKELQELLKKSNFKLDNLNRINVYSKQLKKEMDVYQVCLFSK